MNPIVHQWKIKLSSVALVYRVEVLSLAETFQAKCCTGNKLLRPFTEQLFNKGSRHGTPLSNSHVKWEMKVSVQLFLQSSNRSSDATRADWAKGMFSTPTDKQLYLQCKVPTGVVMRQGLTELKVCSHHLPINSLVLWRVRSPFCEKKIKTSALIQI